MFSCETITENLNQKFRSKLNHGFIESWLYVLYYSEALYVFKGGKISEGNRCSFVALLLVIIMLQLLKVFNAVELNLFKCLKLTVEIQLPFRLCGPFSRNKWNIGGNSNKNIVSLC